MKRIFILIFILGQVKTPSVAQELRFDVNVKAPNIQQADPQLFEQLENQLYDLINNRSWTRDKFAENEQIRGKIDLTITDERNATEFRGELIIQSTRPVYGSAYETTIVNHVDKEVEFAFNASSPLEYSQNVFTDNLSSIIAFYVYYILGLDYDSYSLYGGEDYFQRAQEVINLIPPALQGKSSGWSAQVEGFNRYKLLENILNPAARPFRKGFYDYHRHGLDVMHRDTDDGRQVMVSALDLIEDVYNDIPNAVILQLFANAKAEEVVDVFALGDRDEKNKVYEIMTNIDPSNRNKYVAIRR